ncbi:hypothetical protein IF2G_07249 [Cordyceps javanica]|nr:hypothetical protein IF2G_07249 [Cordyceps javanica]
MIVPALTKVARLHLLKGAVVVQKCAIGGCSLQRRTSSSHIKVLGKGQVASALSRCLENSVDGFLWSRVIALMKCRWQQNPLGPKHGRNVDLDALFLNATTTNGQSLGDRVFRDKPDDY